MIAGFLSVIHNCNCSVFWIKVLCFMLTDWTQSTIAISVSYKNNLFSKSNLSYYGGKFKIRCDSFLTTSPWSNRQHSLHKYISGLHWIQFNCISDFWIGCTFCVWTCHSPRRWQGLSLDQSDDRRKLRQQTKDRGYPSSSTLPSHPADVALTSLRMWTNWSVSKRRHPL